MSARNVTSPRHEQGQAIVIMVVALIAALAMVALIVDGGNAWAQQRVTQNGTDSAADAGATVLAKRLANPSLFASEAAWDGEVLTAMTAAATANEITFDVGYYTDICGIMLRPDGTRATGTGDAARVGAGALPTDLGITPDCPSGQVGPVAGVRALGTHPFNPYIAGLIGQGTFTATADATAVTGYVQEFCDADSGEWCALFPVTVPTTVTTCTNNHRAVITDLPWPKYTDVVLPLCTSATGNVGWIDWHPPGGGVQEIIDSVDNPDNDAIRLPSWNFVSQTGNTNAQALEDALNAHSGEIILFPLFDLTCFPEPDHSQVESAPDYGCSEPIPQGNGQNNWYRFPMFASFLLDTAYINGNNSANCPTSESPSTSCITGQFVDFVTTGTVGPGIGSGTTTTSVIGVQLIK